MSNLITISNVRGFIDENGVAQLNAEDISRGFGFVQLKNGVEYIRWETVNGYLGSFGFSQVVGKDDFLPENMVYRLGFKASNETAERFQTILADEILPTIRKTGAYVVVPKTLPEALRAYANEVEAHEETKLQLASAQKDVEFVSRYVESAALKNFREVAKILGTKEREFIDWLLDDKVVFRQGRSLLPFATYQHTGYFEVKTGEKNGHAYHQTKFTPAGIAWIAQRVQKKGA